MCGRYTLVTADHQQLAQRFGAMMPPNGGLERFNVCPTEEVLAVQSGEGKLLTWGITPKWKGGPLINARVETCFEKQPFSRLITSPKRRCLVLADGFYEWMRSEDGKSPRQPFRFSLATGEPFAFAGLETFGECAILTCAPNPLVARLHDRMPVILAGPDEEAAWLNGCFSKPVSTRALMSGPPFHFGVMPQVRSFASRGWVGGD